MSDAVTIDVTVLKTTVANAGDVGVVEIPTWLAQRHGWAEE